MDRLKALEIFKSVVDHGSFVRCAETMNLPNSVITRAVQELEALLGVRLLQRTTRRMSLTTVGKDVVERAQGLLSSFDELTAISSLSATDASGVVRLLAPVSYGIWRLGPVLAAFAAKYARVRIDLRTTEDDIDIQVDEVDLGICVGACPAPGLIGRRVAFEPVGIYAAPAYLARCKRLDHPAQLCEYHWLGYSGAAAAGPWHFRAPNSVDVHTVPPPSVLSSNSADTLVAAASHGAGLVRLPSFLVERALASGDLVAVLHGWESEPVGVYLVYSSRRNQPLAVRKLIEHLAQTLSPLPDARTASHRLAPDRRVVAEAA